MSAPTIGRRGFLALGGGLTVTFLAGGPLVGCSLPVIPKRPQPDPESAMGWIRHRDGRYRLWLPRAEIGQNIGTALKQVACEELGADWDQVELRLPATGDIAPVRATVGSESVQDFALPLAQACATLREAIAAGRRDGLLAAEPRPMAMLRAFAAGAEGGRHVGRSPEPEQVRAILRGAPVYAADIRLPGMLYGKVLHAPSSPALSARPLSWDAAAAAEIPGFVALVEDANLRLAQSDGLGLLATTPEALDRIAAALRVRWQVSGSFGQADLDGALDIDRRLARGGLSHRLAADRIDRRAPWDVDLRLDIPAGAHAGIEPRAAVAEMREDRLRVWCGSQDSFYIRDVLARRLDLPAAAVSVQAMRAGGAFGGRTLCTVEMEAAVLARAAGRPVKVQWDRGQEFRQAFHRPPSSHRIRARLRGGRIADWWHGFASSHILFTNAALPRWMQAVVEVMGDDGVARGALPGYRIPRRRIEHDLVALPVLTGPWRGLGAGPNGTAIESAIDECARAAGADPLAFRLAHLAEPCLAEVLRRTAAAAGWGDPAAAGRGRGIACGTYKGMSHAAVVADVAVDGNGAVQVERLVCAHDCGLVINPDQVRAQCEGNLVWGLGMAMGDHLPVADGEIKAATFADAPIPRFGEVPAMEVVLVEGGGPPAGAGETAITAASAAILNAVRDATGRRPVRLPLAAFPAATG